MVIRRSVRADRRDIMSGSGSRLHNPARAEYRWANNQPRPVAGVIHIDVAGKLPARSLAESTEGAGEIARVCRAQTWDERYSRGRRLDLLGPLEWQLNPDIVSKGRSEVLGRFKGEARSSPVPARNNCVVAETNQCQAVRI